MKNNVSVIGAGSWGTTIAKVIAENNPELVIKLWAREKILVKTINLSNENDRYLPDIKLPSNIIATNSLYDSVVDSSVIILATPSKAVYETCIKIAKYIPKDSYFGCLSKGLCKVNNEIITISDAIVKAIPSLEGRLVAIIGPSHAEELSKEYHTCLNLGGSDSNSRKMFAKLLSCDYLECRETDDIKGVELGGALKNPAAIALGIISILPHCGDNLSGALISEAMKEMLRIGKVLNAREETLIDISGLGDLVTTSLSDLSRNRRFGQDIAKQIMSTGKSVNIYSKIVMQFRPEHIIEKMSEKFNYLAEGAYAIEPIIELAEKSNISIPVYKALYEVLLNKMNPELLIETVKNPQKFDEICENTKIQVFERKIGMEKTRGTIFKKLIIKKSSEKFVNDSDYRKALFEYRKSYLDRVEKENDKGKFSSKRLEKEYKLFKQLDANNYKKKLPIICKFYVNEFSDIFNFFTFKIFVKYMKLINLKNVIFRKYHGKKLLETNIKISGYLENIRNIKDRTNMVYMSTYRSYFDFVFISFAIDKYGLHVPRFFIDSKIVNSRLKRFLFRLTGGYIIDSDKFSNPVYRDVIETYLSTLIEHGVQILFFPELEISRDGRIGNINKEFLSMIMRSLYKNNEEIALIPTEVSYYRKPSEIEDESSTLLPPLKNILDNRVTINFSDPIFASDFSNTTKALTQLSDTIYDRWRSDSNIFPHYILCKIIKENNNILEMESAKQYIKEFLREYKLENRYKAKQILKTGIEFIEKNDIGQQINGELKISKPEELDYYANLLYKNIETSYNG